jgi:hypothetical protein
MMHRGHVFVSQPFVIRIAVRSTLAWSSHAGRSGATQVSGCPLCDAREISYVVKSGFL